MFFLFFNFLTFYFYCVLRAFCNIGKTHRNKHFFGSEKQYFWSDYGFNGSFENRALPSLHGWSLKTTHTVPLSTQFV